MHAKDLFAVVSLIDSVLSIAVGTLSLIDRLTAKRKQLNITARPITSND